MKIKLEDGTVEERIYKANGAWSTTKTKPYDMVEHPKHYNAYKFEVIDIINQVTPHYDSKLAYHIGNVIKYVMRAPFKNNLNEDLKKAQWYLNEAIKRAGE
ncbi:DUF3310 domain-containing protein [Leuconostoc lactis]